MIGLGLTSEGMEALHSTLASHHCIRTTLRILDLQHTEVRTLTSFFEDGQVNYSDQEGAGSDRSASLSLFDPRFQSGLDSRSPAELTAGPNRLMAITYDVRAPGGSWVSVPVFTGPVTTVRRYGYVVRVECLGKEYLARHAMHSSKSWAKGTRKSDIIKDILTRVCGESSSLVDVPTLSQRTTKTVSLGSEDDPWALAQALAKECDYRLFYDGRGEARLSKPGGNVLYTFRSGQGGTVLTQPESGPDSFEQLINRVRITGVKPAKAKKGTPTPVGVALAPESHPLSPYKLGRNGVGMAWTLDEYDDNAKSKSAATASAKKKLDPYLDTPVSSSFTALPAPHLEIGDSCRLTTDTVSYVFAFGSSSLPLRCSEGQVVGLVGRVSR